LAPKNYIQNQLVVQSTSITRLWKLLPPKNYIRDQLLRNISNNSITRLSHLLAPKLHKSISRNKMKIPL
jgi:hypothetical protein